jgi:hypothetical protein
MRADTIRKLDLLKATTDKVKLPFVPVKISTLDGGMHNLQPTPIEISFIARPRIEEESLFNLTFSDLAVEVVIRIGERRFEPSSIGSDGGQTTWTRR